MSLARAAIEAALRSQSEAVKRVDAAANQITGTKEAGPSFAKSLVEGLERVNSVANRAQELPGDLVSGRIQDLHEVSVALKQSELTFKFALEVRNKLIDAYRETMRMGV